MKAILVSAEEKHSICSWLQICSLVNVPWKAIVVGIEGFKIC